jgi:hypothetical protein
VVDYALEAEVVLPRRPECGSFGFVVRGAQQVGVHICGPDAPSVLSIRSVTPALLLNEPVEAASGRHLYRLEIHPSTIRVLIDGVEVAEVTETDGPETGSLGLFNDHTELEIRQFRVVRL